MFKDYGASSLQPWLCSEVKCSRPKTTKALTLYPKRLMLAENSNTPDFKHKVTRKALWLDGWSTPSWVKEELLVSSGGKSQSQMDKLIRDTQDVACLDRYNEKGLVRSVVCH